MAVLLMVVYHGAYDLTAYYGWNLDLFGPGWTILEKGTASLFLGLVGVSFAVAWDRTRQARGTRAAVARTVRRAAVVLAGSVLVSIATYVVDPATFVRFGILQAIGTSMLILPLFVPLRELAAIIGIGIIALGRLVVPMTAPSILLLPFGVMPAGFASVDYFPLVPWLGVVLIGYALGTFVYVRGHRPAGWSRFGGSTTAILAWPGRHALPIYLIHQPLLLALFILTLGQPAI